MSRTEVAVVALIVLLMAWLLMPPPVAPDAPPAIDPCPQMWDATRGLYGGCTVFLPIVVHCAECMSAWPVWPGKGE